MPQNKKSRKRKARGEGQGDMPHSRSLRFINALNGYKLEQHVGLSELADLCEVPLSQVNAWFSLTSPFPGTIPKRVLSRFCANAGVGRDELMAYGNSVPLIGFVKSSKLEDAPEYVHRQLERRKELPETLGIPDSLLDEELPSNKEVFAAGKDVVLSETAALSSPQGVSSDPVAAASSTPNLTPFEQAILTLLREHDAAVSVVRPAAPKPDGLAAPSVDPEDYVELERLTDEAHAALEAANKTIESLQEKAAADEKALRRKNNEIDRLNAVVSGLESRGLCSDAYRDYIDRDPLFAKRNLTPIDAYTAAATLWKDRLFFTKKAVADIRGYHGDAHELLEALRALAVPLRDCLMSDNQLDEPGLRAVCGFEVSLHESDFTLNNKRCRQERTASYNGEDKVFEKHLKAGNGAGCLRIYFDADRTAGCVVIGRCGAHLPSRMKF